MSNTEEIRNKIVSYETLKDIFYKLNDKLNYYLNIYKNEEFKNRMLDYNSQVWTFKDSGSKLSFIVHFKDNSSITFEKFENFMSVFETRLQEIERMNVHFYLSYRISDGYTNKYYNQDLHFNIYEDSFEYKVNLDNSDDKLSDIYEYIRTKINESPERYDDVIKNKNKIIPLTGFAIGFIPSIILVTLTLFVPTVKESFKSGIVLYPLAVIILTYFIGLVVGNSMFSDLYKNINPKQKYVGYDKGAIYKDDIDKFTNQSEVLIGKNINNIKSRKEIKEKYEKYKSFIPKELIALLIFSVIVIII